MFPGHDINIFTQLDEKSSLHKRRRFLAQMAGTACALCATGFLPSEIFAQDDSGKANLLPFPNEADDTRFIAEARHWKREGEVILCKLCPRECRVPRDERGYCGVRENRNDQYKTLVYARPCTIHIDPIEKKPLFHFLPGTLAFSLATAGCNIECKFCQNWQISQMRPEQVESAHATPRNIIETAKSRGCPTVAFTYSEPVIFYEYAYDIAQEGKKQNVQSVMISNGYIQKEPMTEICKQLSAVKIDLKAFTETFYKDTCKGELRPVLDTLELLKQSGLWFEIVVLIIPTLNDGEEECRNMARWIREKLGPDIPVHFTRFHPMYKLANLPSTPVDILTRNYEIAKAEGLHFPYVGNVPGHPGENTYCPSCKKVVIKRYGFSIESSLQPGGLCPGCKTRIPGVWG